MDQNSTQTKLMGEHDAAQFLGLKVSTLRRWRWAGRGPLFLKLGGAVRYDQADLDSFVNKCRYASTTGYGAQAAQGESDDILDTENPRSARKILRHK